MDRESLPLTTHTQQAWANFSNGNSQSIHHPIALTSGQDFNLGIKAPVKTASQTSTQTFEDTWKKPRLRPYLFPEKNTKIPNLQNAHGAPLVQTIWACNMRQLQPIPQLPGHPSEWYLRDYMETSGAAVSWQIPPFLLLGSPLPILLSALPSKKSEGLCPRVPLSVLYEALQVSSSLKRWRERYPMSANTCSSAPGHLVLTVGVGGDTTRGSCFWRIQAYLLSCMERWW